MHTSQASVKSVFDLIEAVAFSKYSFCFASSIHSCTLHLGTQLVKLFASLSNVRQQVLTRLLKFCANTKLRQSSQFCVAVANLL